MELKNILLDERSHHRDGSMPVLSHIEMEKASLTELGSVDVVCRGYSEWVVPGKILASGVFNKDGYGTITPNGP